MANVNISVTRPGSGLAVTPDIAGSTHGSTVVWTLDAAIAGVFNPPQPIDWFTDCGPPQGACSTPTISNAGRTLTINITTTTELNLAYKLFVRLGTGKIISTTYGPIGNVPVGGGNPRLPPSSPKIKNV